MKQVGYINIDGKIIPLMLFSKRELQSSSEADEKDEDAQTNQSVLGARTIDTSYEFTIDVNPKTFASVRNKVYNLEPDTFVYYIDNETEDGKEVICSNNEVDIQSFDNEDLSDANERLVKPSTMQNVERVIGLID